MDTLSPLNQTSGSSVQAPNEVKAWAVAQSRTPGNPQRADWPNEHHAWSCEWHLNVFFPRLCYQGTKKAVGTRNLWHTLPIACNLTTSQCQPKWTALELSLPGRMAAQQWSPLELGHPSRLFWEAERPFY